MILIDTREGHGPYIQKRLEAAGIDTDIVTFPQETGTDYLITNEKGSCAVQRKVVCSEFINELDEILYEIVPRLMAFSDNPVLLVEENFAISEDGFLMDRQRGYQSQMQATAYYGVLETIRKAGCDVQTTRDLNCSIWWMIALHGYLGKHHYPKHKKYHTVKEQAAGMLMCVPGIGEHRAEKALKENSIRNMSNLKKVPGLTEPMSKRLTEVLRWQAD